MIYNSFNKLNIEPTLIRYPTYIVYIPFVSDVTDTSLVQNKQFLPKETLVYVRLVRYALQALDIYTINVSPNGQAVVRPAV